MLLLQSYVDILLWLSMKTIVKRVLNKIDRTIFGKSRAKKSYEEGFTHFMNTGETPESAYKALINLYCMTNGVWNKNEQKKIALSSPAKKQTMPITGIVGTWDEKKFEEFNNVLNKNGYKTFDIKLPEEMVNRLHKFALENPSTIPPAYDKNIIYDPNNPLAEIYRFDMNDLLNNEDVQKIMMDPVFINIARNYLGSEPIFDFPTMWWSTSILKEASVEAAQLYHFDLDRIKWLKLFLFLTDVDDEHGPHAYIQSSHLPNKKPKTLLKRGYSRIPDTDIKKYYPKEDFKTIGGEAGSMFMGDTKCWHKGTPLKKGHRLVFELEYTSSMFGAKHPKLTLTKATPEFKKFCQGEKLYCSNISLN